MKGGGKGSLMQEGIQVSAVMEHVQKRYNLLNGGILVAQCCTFCRAAWKAGGIVILTGPLKGWNGSGIFYCCCFFFFPPSLKMEILSMLWAPPSGIRISVIMSKTLKRYRNSVSGVRSGHFISSVIWSLQPQTADRTALLRTSSSWEQEE